MTAVGRSVEGHEAQVRRAYDTVAEPYTAWAGPEISPATEGPVDRAVLHTFVELVAAGPVSASGAAGPASASGAGGPASASGAGGPVADLGCGPGRVAAYLAAHGLAAVGLDLSPAMVGQARAAHPALPFVSGALAALPFADGALAGAVCWYSIIHTPPERLAAVAHELARVLRPAGELLVAFQAGNGGRRHRAEAFGRPIDLVNFGHDPDAVADGLAGAGLIVHTRVVREPDLAHESSAQAFILARRPAGSLVPVARARQRQAASP